MKTHAAAIDAMTADERQAIVRMIAGAALKRALCTQEQAKLNGSETVSEESASGRRANADRVAV